MVSYLGYGFVFLKQRHIAVYTNRYVGFTALSLQQLQQYAAFVLIQRGYKFFQACNFFFGHAGFVCIAFYLVNKTIPVRKTLCALYAGQWFILFVHYYRYGRVGNGIVKQGQLLFGSAALFIFSKCPVQGLLTG